MNVFLQIRRGFWKGICAEDRAICIENKQCTIGDFRCAPILIHRCEITSGGKLEWVRWLHPAPKFHFAVTAGRQSLPVGTEGERVDCVAMRGSSAQLHVRE